MEKRIYCLRVCVLAGVGRHSGRLSSGETNILLLLLLISSLKFVIDAYHLKKDPVLHYRFFIMPNRVLRNSKHLTLWTNLVTWVNQKGKESLIKVTW